LKKTEGKEKKNIKFEQMNVKKNARYLRVKLLVEFVQTVDITLGLGGNSPDFKPNTALRDTSLKLCNTPDTNILEGVLQTGLEIGDKLGDGAAVQDRPTI
jgi:hypothetical protein